MEANQTIEEDLLEQAGAGVDQNENLRQFYLQEARMMCPSANESRSERAHLEILHLRLKKMCRLLVMLDNYPWSESNSLIQKACGVYMVEAQDSKKERLQLNQCLADRTLFMSEIFGCKDLINHTLSYYKKQYNDVKGLLNAKQ